MFFLHLKIIILNYKKIIRLDPTKSVDGFINCCYILTLRIPIIFRTIVVFNGYNEFIIHY